MRPLPSIRQRLSRALVWVSLAWSLGVAAVVGLVMRHEMQELLDDTLVESAQMLQGLLSAQALQLPLQVGALAPTAPHGENLAWQIVDSHQRVLLRSFQAPPHALVAVRTRGFANAGDDWHVHVSELRPDLGLPGGVLMVAQRTTERAHALREVSLYTALMALGVSLLCAWWLSLRASQELRPLSDLSRAVGEFDPLLPKASLPQAQRAELQPMQQAITELGLRLARRVANEHAFTAHAAHALRTPLAGMVAQLAAAQRVPSDQIQPMLVLARQAADRLRRVVTALLTLFRSGSEVNRQTIHLNELVAQLQVNGLVITVPPEARLVADPDLLAAALANLLDNALRHGATQLGITVIQEHGHTRLVLTDDGPGIAEPERLRLQTALDQQDYQRCPGMGLMLADLVARAHGGALRLASSTTGCTVEMTLA